MSQQALIKRLTQLAASIRQSWHHGESRWYTDADSQDVLDLIAEHAKAERELAACKRALRRVRINPDDVINLRKVGVKL
jgi:hypothetical protein